MEVFEGSGLIGCMQLDDVCMYVCMYTLMSTGSIRVKYMYVCIYMYVLYVDMIQ